MTKRKTAKQQPNNRNGRIETDVVGHVPERVHGGLEQSHRIRDGGLVDRSEELRAVVRPGDALQRPVTGEAEEGVLEETEGREREEFEGFGEDELEGTGPLGAVSTVAEEGLDAGLRDSLLGFQGIRTAAQDLGHGCETRKEN